MSAYCTRCHGHGEVTVGGRSVNPFSGVDTPDPQEAGTFPCDACHGTGFAPYRDRENYDAASDECSLHYFETGEHLDGCPHAARIRYPRVDVRRSPIAAASNPSANGARGADLLGLAAPADPSTDRKAA